MHLKTTIIRFFKSQWSVIRCHTLDPCVERSINKYRSFCFEILTLIAFKLFRLTNSFTFHWPFIIDENIKWIMEKRKTSLNQRTCFIMKKGFTFTTMHMRITYLHALVNYEIHLIFSMYIINHARKCITNQYWKMHVVTPLHDYCM